MTEGSYSPSRQCQTLKNSINSNQVSSFKGEKCLSRTKQAARHQFCNQSKSRSPKSDYRGLFSSQKLVFNKQSQLSSLQILSITLMKVIVKQNVFEFGYSPLKIQILKLITALPTQISQKELNKQNRFLKSEQSYKEMKTLINCGVKIISKDIWDRTSFKKSLLEEKSREEQYDNLNTVHQCVTKYMKEFSICLNFMVQFLLLVLKLVNLIHDESDVQKLKAKQVFYILCDYVGCKIQENSHGFLINNNFFIKEGANSFTHGFIFQESKPKSFRLKRCTTEDSEDQAFEQITELNSKSGFKGEEKTDRSTDEPKSVRRDWKYFTLENKNTELISSRFKKKLNSNFTKDSSDKAITPIKQTNERFDSKGQEFNANEFLYSTIDPQRITFSKKVQLERAAKVQVPYPHNSQSRMPFICYNCGEQKHLALNRNVIVVKLDPNYSKKQL